jgi:hypothetical protein
MKNKLTVKFLALAAVTGAMLLAATSCVSTTAPDGTVTERVDNEAVNPFLILARDLFTKPAPPVPIIPLDAK